MGLGIVSDSACLVVIRWWPRTRPRIHGMPAQRGTGDGIRLVFCPALNLLSFFRGANHHRCQSKSGCRRSLPASAQTRGRSQVLLIRELRAWLPNGWWLPACRPQPHLEGDGVHRARRLLLRVPRRWAGCHARASSKRLGKGMLSEEIGRPRRAFGPAVRPPSEGVPAGLAVCRPRQGSVGGAVVPMNNPQVVGFQPVGVKDVWALRSRDDS